MALRKTLFHLKIYTNAIQGFVHQKEISAVFIRIEIGPEPKGVRGSLPWGIGEGSKVATGLSPQQETEQDNTKDRSLPWGIGEVSESTTGLSPQDSDVTDEETDTDNRTGNRGRAVGAGLRTAGQEDRRDIKARACKDKGHDRRACKYRCSNHDRAGYQANYYNDHHYNQAKHYNHYNNHQDNGNQHSDSGRP